MFIVDNDFPLWLDVLFFIASWFVLFITVVAVFIGTEWLLTTIRQRREHSVRVVLDSPQQLVFDFRQAEENVVFFQKIEEFRSDFN